MNQTIHRLITSEPEQDAADPMYVWVDNDDYVHILGERPLVEDLHAALTTFLERGELGEPIDEFDPRFGDAHSIAQAVAEAVDVGYADDPLRMADTIRAAARAGRIRGASQTPTGRWLLPRRTFRAWLVRYHPKPRKETCGGIDATG